MKTPVDNMLTSRIKQVFDEFEDPAADAGWEQLRKKYPERNRRPLILWLSSAAALLFLATGLWFVNSQETPVVMKPSKGQKALAHSDKTIPVSTADSVNSTKTAQKRRSEQETPTELKESTPGVTEPETEKTLLATLPTEEEVVSLQPSAELSSEKVSASAPETEIPLSRAATLVIKSRHDFDKIAIEQAKKPTFVEEVTPITREDEIPLSRASALVIKTRQDFDKIQIKEAKKPTYITDVPRTVFEHEIPLSRAATLVIKPRQDFDKVLIQQAKKPTYITDEKALATALVDEIPLSRAATLVIKPRQDFDEVLIEQAKKPTYIREFNPVPVENEKKDENVNAKAKKLALSVYAGSYFNYAEGSENQLNFGAGFTSDIRLSRNIKLSTGLSIASNSLNYDKGQNVPESAASSLHSVAPSTGQNLSLNLTTITRYSASLLTLDVPVNIKYQFAPESDKIYVLAGLSSGTYLNETYGYQYRNFNTASGSYSSQAKAQEITKQLNDFDFARTLNLSFGMSTAFGKTQTISIEPFIKYPLGGLGTEDLKFGSTGINLKIRFNPSKK